LATDPQILLVTSNPLRKKAIKAFLCVRLKQLH
jgi:hypothetical protein